MTTARMARDAQPKINYPEGATTFTVKEAAQLLGVSERWLATKCRDEEVTHLHIARKRRLTTDQIDKILREHTVRPQGTEEIDAEKARVIARLQKYHSLRADEAKKSRR